MDEIDRYIINTLQDGFPICDAPYQQVAVQLGLTERELIDRLQALLDNGTLTRFGPLYHAELMGGALTLAAVKAPPERFDEIVGIINAFPEVAHNYARNHALNMWFVIATEQSRRIAKIIGEIEAETGLKVYPMPKSREFFVEFRVEV